MPAQRVLALQLNIKDVLFLHIRIMLDNLIGTHSYHVTKIFDSKAR